MNYTIDNIENESMLENGYLTFPIGENEWGIHIEYVAEIINLQTISKVPNMPDFVEGVMNLRGKIIPIINIRSKFNIDKIDFNERTSIIVVNYEELTVGLIVDYVKDVLTIEDKDMSAYPNKNKSLYSNYIKSIARIDDKVKLIMDLDKLLKSEAY